MIERITSPLRPMALFIIRIAMGTLFLQSGYGKINHLPKVIEYFTSLGIPAANIQAPMIACLELVGGTALVLGLYSEVFAALLTGTMVVATITAKKEDINGLSSLLESSEVLYALLLIQIATFGAGRFSVISLWNEFIRTRAFGRKKS